MGLAGSLLSSGVSGTVTFGEFLRIHGDGFALRIAISAQGTTITLGLP